MNCAEREYNCTISNTVYHMLYISNLCHYHMHPKVMHAIITCVRVPALPGIFYQGGRPLFSPASFARVSPQGYLSYIYIPGLHQPGLYQPGSQIQKPWIAQRVFGSGQLPVFAGICFPSSIQKPEHVLGML